jgi:hypothetical protein
MVERIGCLNEYGIITYAYGPKKYLDMAKTLARSLAFHSTHISRAIVTDNIDDLEVFQLFDHVIPWRPEFGSNVRQKLFLNIYSPYKKSLYIDSDCIVIRDINFIFKSLSGINFCAVGRSYSKRGDKNKFLNIDFALDHFQLEKIPNFNGGIYYFEKNDVSEEIFSAAQAILKNYRNSGFTEFRSDGPAEEPIISVAMALKGQKTFDDKYTMMLTTIGLRGKLDVDILESRCSFRKYNTHVSPAIVHFPNVWIEHPVYQIQAKKIKNFFLTGEHLQEKYSSIFVYYIRYYFLVLKYAISSLPRHSRNYIKLRIMNS